MISVQHLLRPYTRHILTIRLQTYRLCGTAFQVKMQLIFSQYRTVYPGLVHPCAYENERAVPAVDRHLFDTRQVLLSVDIHFENMRAV